MEDQHKKFLNFYRELLPRIIMFMLIDLVLVFAAFVIGCWFPQAAVGGTNGYHFPFYRGTVVLFNLPQIACFAAAYMLAFAVFGLYNSLWQVSGISEAIKMLAGVGTGTILVLLINIPFGNQYKSFIIISAVALVPLVFFSRFSFRIARRGVSRIRNSRHAGKRAVLVVGAGFFGAYVRSQIDAGEEATTSYIACFVDDDPAKQGMRVGGVKVCGRIKDIPELVKKHNISEIIIAIPSLSSERKAEVVALCHQTGCHVRTVPGLQELSAAPSMKDLRETKISDVLFRKEVDLDKESISQFIQHKTVLITGGGGSIGSEIARQVARFYPNKIILFDIYENTTYELYCELKHDFPWVEVIIRIGSVREKARIDAVMEEFHPELVVHTAAHKHVPLMEQSPAEAIKNNILGTRNVLRSADEHGVVRFVQLSTDKAVNPTNVMGATKRVTELIVQQYARSSKMLCMTVRFGNVLGSHGSVIPLFEKQIQSGGPVLVTHPDITRYFMTIPEAAQLVLQAVTLGDSGAIYVLDMGEPVKIMDLAEKVIRFHGYTPNVDMPIEIIGLRAGEKMYEELLMADEAGEMDKTAHGRIFRAHPAKVDEKSFDRKLDELIRAAASNNDDLIARLKDIVPSFAPQSERGTGAADRAAQDTPKVG